MGDEVDRWAVHEVLIQWHGSGGERGGYELLWARLSGNDWVRILWGLEVRVQNGEKWKRKGQWYASKRLRTHLPQTTTRRPCMAFYESCIP